MGQKPTNFYQYEIATYFYEDKIKFILNLSIMHINFKCEFTTKTNKIIKKTSEKRQFKSQRKSDFFISFE